MVRGARRFSGPAKRTDGYGNYVRMSERGVDPRRIDEVARDLGCHNLAHKLVDTFPGCSVVPFGPRLTESSLYGFGLDIPVPLTAGFQVPLIGGPLGKTVVLLDHPVCLNYSLSGQLVGIHLDAGVDGEWKMGTPFCKEYGNTLVSIVRGPKRTRVTHPRVVIDVGVSEIIVYRRGKNVDAFC